MRKLPFITGLLFLVLNTFAQSPHGGKLKIDCAVCHTTKSWSYSIDSSKFSHSQQTKFILEGQHQFTSCIKCHKTLVFSDAEPECIACHTDMHNTTVGTDCARCHNSNSWIIENITELHQRSRFPLLGAHNTADCSDCHKSSSRLEFEPIGIGCIDCHRQNLLETTKPNHQQAGFSENCYECHNVNAHEWNSTGFNHNFFALTKGHEINDCARCHGDNILEPRPKECYTCHQSDYNSATNPKHRNTIFSTSCDQCHSTDPGWKPAKFENHDQFYFPVYSGRHRDTWNDCSECHSQPDNYAIFKCTNCHEHDVSKMNKNHKSVSGYSSENNACFACHPQGNKEGSFNHNNTNFSLTGAHTSTGCLDCHKNGYGGTSMLCNNCHTNNYTQAANPSHTAAGIATTCTTCHTTSGWKPSPFNHTTTGFGLTGAHAGRQCSDCHKGTIVGASPECYSCHQQNYNKVEGHLLLGYPHQCTQCHNTSSWKDATFNHNATSFPLTGVHKATGCLSCHTNGFAGTPTDCASCHQKNYSQATNPSHTAAGIAAACAACHTTSGWKPSPFNHTTTGFGLTGAHVGRQCSDCHKGTTAGASPECYSCHQQNYNKAEGHLLLGYPHQCTQCHNTSSWAGSTFNHNATSFPLTGVHKATGCLSCHTNGFAGTPTDCASCHQKNYTQAANPNHTAAGIATACAACHTTSGWKPSPFNHTTTGFGLTGAHVGRQCSDCHKGTTVGASPECYSCHQTNYSQAAGHLVQGFPHQCTQCHNTSSWKDATFNHNATSFPLTGAHIATECSACHTKGFAGTPTDCAFCHQTNYSQAANPNHTAAGIATACAACHTTSGWKPSPFNHTTTGFGLTGAHVGRQCSDCHKGTTAGASPECYSCHQKNYSQAPGHLAQGYPHQCTQCHNTSSWKDATFNHNTTSFPLTGAHVATQCSACHAKGFAGTPTDCASCHQTNYSQAANPNHTAAGIATACAACHTTSGWKPSPFNHTTTGFGLTGAHVGRQCSDCHKGTTVGASPECYSCHQKNYSQAPGHLAQGYPHQCTQCHNTSSWKDATFNHNATNFPLTGVHIAQQCSSCHTKGFAGTPTDCASCHQKNYSQATNPNHTAAGIATACAACHTTSGWKPSPFNHTTTGFGLTGAHAGRQCSDCHKGTTVGASPECYSCHQQNYNKAEGHLLLGYPHQCTQCHNTSSWAGSTFNHNATSFPLTGAHIATECSACHTKGFAGTPTDCASCHQTNYSQAANPNHTAAGIATACAACHTTSGWKPSPFNHTTTGFGLTGSHAGRQCSDCHKGTTVGASPECYSCHQQNYNKAEGHLLLGYPHQCTQCHNTSSWKDATFNHNATSFPLTGVHKATGCLSCHTNGFAGTPTDCASCHQKNYSQATNPSHTAAGIAAACAACHTTSGWKPSPFNHTTTGFGLTGAHVGRQCSDCHKGTTAGASPECYSCHQQNYSQATNPNHRNLGLSTGCNLCHTTNPGWQPASFPVHQTYYRLNGAHVAVANDCYLCHAGNYTNTPNTCIGCHSTDYNNTKNPAHKTAQFPTDCQSCHSENAWTPSTFNHDGQYFPINSGKHKGEWNLCTDCHNAPTNYSVFACTNCHEHNLSSTASHHSGVRGYVYNSTNCYSCHPKGRAD